MLCKFPEIKNGNQILLSAAERMGGGEVDKGERKKNKKPSKVGLTA